MFQFLGYNFCSDQNCLDNAPTDISNITSTTLKNGIFDRYYATQDTSYPYSTTIPDVWDYLTIMDANFNGSINAGNIDFTLSQIDSIKIKRRKVGTFTWLTLMNFEVNSLDDLKIVFNDILNQNYQEYEYAFVPVLNGIEGNFITNSIQSQFDGVFICSMDEIFKFYSGVQYGGNTRVQATGIFQPFSRQFPIVVSNGALNYDTGSVTGTVLPVDFDTTRNFDRFAMVNRRKDLLDFLTNKQAKILKDWNGNIWLIMITGTPTTAFKNSYGMGIADVTFQWTEIGNVENQIDLYMANIVNEVS